MNPLAHKILAGVVSGLMSQNTGAIRLEFSYSSLGTGRNLWGGDWCWYSIRASVK